MKPVRTAATLLAGLALTAAPVLTACSQSSEGSDSSSSAASDSSAESDKGDAKDSETQDSKKDAEADKDDDKASASASASATKSDLPKATPAGYQEITAPTVGISFAVPEGWQATPLDGTSDIYYKAPDTGTEPYLGNANVSKTTVPALTSIPGGTSTGYSTEQTANGEAAVLNYTANIGGQTVNGSLIATPTKEKGKYAIIAVNAGSSGQSIDELRTTILETIH